MRTEPLAFMILSVGWLMPAAVTMVAAGPDRPRSVMDFDVALMRSASW
jgi:hypothetical protein